MNFKTILLASAAVMMTSTAAMAHHSKKTAPKPTIIEDITSPFYIPAEGKMFSETSLEYSRLNLEDTNNSNDGWYAKQTISYGLSNDMSIFAAVGNTFDNTVNSNSGAYNNSHNFDYTVGAKYNKDFDNIKTQLSIAYNTYQPHSFGTQGSTAWNQYVDLGAKIGYQMSCDAIPYISFNANYGLDVVNNTKLDPLNSPEEDRFTYTTYAGVYKEYDKFSTDMGIRWENVREALKNKDASRDDVYAQATVNYKLADDMSVGIFGDYLIGDSQMGNIEYGYTLGANLKVAF